MAEGPAGQGRGCQMAFHTRARRVSHKWHLGFCRGSWVGVEEVR